MKNQKKSQFFLLLFRTKGGEDLQSEAEKGAEVPLGVVNGEAFLVADVGVVEYHGEADELVAPLANYSLLSCFLLFPVVSLSQEFFQFVDIAARNGNGIVTVTHHELHGTGIGGYLFRLTEIDHKGTMTTDYHRISL